MQRHSFDPTSAVLGVATIALAIFVISGHTPTISTGGDWWLPAVALLVGLILIPWQRLRADRHDHD